MDEKILKAKYKHEGREFTNKSLLTYKIIEYISPKKVKIQFTKSKNEKFISFNHAISSNVADRNISKAKNIGYMGNGKYKGCHNGKSTVIYRTWRSMISRCYNNDITYKSYKDTEVCREWHNFQNFAEWYENNYIDGFEIDKDLLSDYKKIYSPETCCFLPKSINIAMQYGKGYSYDKSCNNYQVIINKHGTEKIYFRVPNKKCATIIYRRQKKLYLKELAEAYKDFISKKAYFALVDFL